MRVVLDSSVIVALLVANDTWNPTARALLDALGQQGHVATYFDCVIAESASAAVRRLEERHMTGQAAAVIDRLESLVLEERITWLLPQVAGVFLEVLALMRSSSGALNFNDALIALACRERDIPAIASFDADFDHVPWLRRLGRPEDVMA